jgi:hypothetical protein
LSVHRIGGLPWDEFIAFHVREILAGTAIAIVAAFFLWGYAQSRERGLSGEVSSHGKPVVFGTITAMTADNRAFTAPIKPDGTYEIRGLPPGDVRISVSSPSPVPVVPQAVLAAEQEAATRAAADGDGSRTRGPGVAGVRGSGKGGKPAGSPADDPLLSLFSADGSPESRLPPPAAAAGWFKIPGQYANPNTSGLRASVNSKGRTKLDLKVD